MFSGLKSRLANPARLVPSAPRAATQQTRGQAGRQRAPAAQHEALALVERAVGRLREEDLPQRMLMVRRGGRASLWDDSVPVAVVNQQSLADDAFEECAMRGCVCLVN